ncbi:MAG TPA: CBS domain-containing protein [Acidimicrobiales bacterium]
MYVQSILAGKGDDVATIGPDATVREAVALLNERRVGALVVSTDGHRIDGILSERDVVRSLAADASAVLDQSVADLMTRQVTTCAPKDTIEQLMWLMTDKRIRHVPVVDETGDLAGIVSIGDVVKHRLGQLETENQALYDYITHGR